MITIKKERIWHENFLKYMDKVVNHQNYKGLAFKYNKDGKPSWIASKKSDIGKQRLQWADEKIKELGLDHQQGKYAKVMFQIHPTKNKVCQVCGQTMSIRYIYPNYHAIKYFTNNFDYEFDVYDDMFDIAEKISHFGDELKKYLIEKLNLDSSFISRDIGSIINEGEKICRLEDKSVFGPGAMSNFPDRYDGFHTYNRCCRSTNDTGRSKENMASYNKDRRAYENWSDGNIAAANQMMGSSSLFKGVSADHIGPISLGFKHDPYYLQPMSRGDNSSKRDRIYEDDLDKLIKIEKETRINPASTFAEIIWEFIKNDYQNFKTHSLEDYQSLLKQNMVNYMTSLWFLKGSNNTDENNELINIFFEIKYFEPKYEDFKYIYTFDEIGKLSGKKDRNITDSTRKEFERFKRISMQSIEDYNTKGLDNRIKKHNLSIVSINQIKKIRQEILNGIEFDLISLNWDNYIKVMQKELLEKALILSR